MLLGGPCLNNMGLILTGLCISVLHFVWFALLLSSPAPEGVTAVKTIVDWCGGSRYLASGVFGVSSLAAAWGFWDRSHFSRSLALVIPQMVLLFFSAAGAAVAISQAHYADRESRPWQFIASDQVVWIILFFAQIVVVAILFGGEGNEDATEA